MVLSWPGNNLGTVPHFQTVLYEIDLLIRVQLHSAGRCGFGRPIQSNSPIFLMLSDSLGWEKPAEPEAVCFENFHTGIAAREALNITGSQPHCHGVVTGLSTRLQRRVSHSIQHPCSRVPATLQRWKPMVKFRAVHQDRARSTRGRHHATSSLHLHILHRLGGVGHNYTLKHQVKTWSKDS